MSAPQSWEELELPVLRWVHELYPDDTAIFSRSEASESFPHLTGAQVDDALRRLHGHGLIEGNLQETSGLFYWTWLRPTGDGLRVLGEWPPAEEAALNDVLAEVLRRLADDLPEDDATATRRAGSAARRFSKQALIDLGKAEAQRLAREAVTGEGDGTRP